MTAHILQERELVAASHDQTDARAAEFGFWLYIMSDCVLFASLFAGYAVLSGGYAGGPTGRDLFHLPYVFAETMLLLTSSLSCGYATLALRRGEGTRVLGWLVVTFVLGLGFVGLEIAEFRQLILEGNGPERSAFLSSFFTLVGTHGTHVAIGLVWMAVMLVQVRIKGLTPAVAGRLERLSVFWHFLDIIWVGVFTVVYLMGSM
jgi:cytochrome o ubiquinol oxidase subunit 3